MTTRFPLVAYLALLACSPSPADDRFQLMDVFRLEHAADPRISPDGKQVVYVRNFMDVKKDRRRSHLWIINADGAAATLTRQFRTTLSEPIGEEQWRVLGEGAVYRILSDLAPARITRPVLKSAERLQLERPHPPAVAASPASPLGLRIEPRLAERAVDLVSVSDR